MVGSGEHRRGTSHGTVYAVLALLLGIWPSHALGAELVLRFKDSPQVTGQVVRFSDLVDVLRGQGTDVDALQEAPLGPAPREGEQQAWTDRDVVLHLELRGVRPESVRWSGPTRVTIQQHRPTPVELRMNSMTPAFLHERAIKQAEQVVRQAISEYLSLRKGQRTDWRISVDVPSDVVPSLQSRRAIARIGGGAAPWTGQQKFVLEIVARGNSQHLTVQADVQLPPMVLVANRPMRRGEIITEQALAFEPLSSRQASQSNTSYFTAVDQLIGKQLKRSVSTGLPIASDFVGEPMVVGRNEMIELESVAGSIVVRTTAKSLGTGAVGDLIEVETIPGRKRMLATVVAPMKVRIAAASKRAEAKLR